MSDIDVSVILPTYNNASVLKESLASYNKLLIDNLKVELIIVDNNSSDDTSEIISQYNNSHICKKYLFEPQQGKSYALNSAIESAKGNFIFFTDDDVNVSPQWLIKGMKYLRVDADMVGGKIKPLWQSKRPVWLKDNMLKMLAVLDYGDSPLKIEAFSMMLYGANMACKREIIDKYGNFSTKLGVSGGKLSGFEDTEFFFRLVENGAIAYYVPEMVVYHKIPSTRCQKKYFTKWAVDRSYSNVEYDLLCTDKIKKHQVYGVPRWLYKKMFISFVNWLVNRMFNSADFSFEYKLIMLGNMSMIRAYRDLNKKK